MEKNILGIEDRRSFLARLTIALAPQDDLIHFAVRDLKKSTIEKSEASDSHLIVPARAARFLGSI